LKALRSDTSARAPTSYAKNLIKYRCQSLGESRRPYEALLRRSTFPLN
jgi:hypothetical protein